MKQFCILNENEYKDFQEKSAQRSFMNSIEAINLKKTNGWDVEYAGVKEDGRLIAATPLTYIPVMKVYRFCHAQGGLLADYSDMETLTFFTEELKKYLSGRRVMYMLMNPCMNYVERDAEGNQVEGGYDNSYVKEALDLDNAAGPFALEITAGDPGDNNARYFYQGAIDVLNPYIESGKLNIVSGQKEFNDVATPTWQTKVAQDRAEHILSSYYADGTNVDVWLCSNDSTALGVENALAANYTGTYPIITGQDCDIENTKNMIAGKQSMSVFKDTRTLAEQVVKMVGQILNGETVDVNDTTTYDNNVIVVPSYLCDPVFADANNYKEILIDSGYYTEDQLQ